LAQLLITGGAGLIGSHTCLVLLQAGHSLVVLDNFTNSSPEALTRVADLAGPSAAAQLQVVEGDIRSATDLACAFAASPAGQPIEAVIHFAGLKAVGDSVQQPLHYWDVNLADSRSMLTAMQTHGCRSIAFSSSATL
jgi:UDP-glucose 4-epimerase